MRPRSSPAEQVPDIVEVLRAKGTLRRGWPVSKRATVAWSLAVADRLAASPRAWWPEDELFHRVANELLSFAAQYRANGHGRPQSGPASPDDGGPGA